MGKQRNLLNLLNRSWLNILGLSISKIKDLEICSTDPGSILYDYSIREILTELALERWRTTNQTTESGEPNLISLAVARAFRENERLSRENELRKTLNENIGKSSIGNACERIGLGNNEAPGLKDVPPWVVHYPWDAVDVADRIRMINDVVLEENREFGHDLDAYNGGSLIAGFPATEKKVEIEVLRLLGLMKSFEAKGYVFRKDSKDLVRATILKNDDGDWRWIVRGGVHRVSVAYALGFKTIPGLVKRVVYRCDVDCWPGVKNGIFTRDGALKVFDLSFHGRGRLDLGNRVV